MAKFLYWFTGKLKCRIISSDGSPYLERYYLCTIFGLRFFIHRFVASDPDRGLHDHPWKWALSLILSGGYTELKIRKGFASYLCSFKRKPGRFNYISGNTFHRVLLNQKQEAWSLFAHGERIKDWGFLTYETRDEMNGQMYKPRYYPVNLSVERKQNEHWWSRPDSKTGNQMRDER